MYTWACVLVHVLCTPELLCELLCTPELLSELYWIEIKEQNIDRTPAFIKEMPCSFSEKEEKNRRRNRFTIYSLRDKFIVLWLQEIQSQNKAVTPSALLSKG